MTDNPVGSVVIVGAGAGGDAAAVGLRKHGFEGDVTFVGPEPVAPYERPHLSKQFLTGESNLEKVTLRPAGEYQRLGISHRAGRTVTRGDLERRQVTLDDGEVLSFETLVLATGAKPRKLPEVPDVPNVRYLRSLRDAVELKSQLDAINRILVLGAGFIGAEVASSARTLGKEVLLVELAPVPLERVLGHDIGEVYASMHREHGTDLRVGTSVANWIADDGRLTAVELSDGSKVDVDLALIAVGVAPNVALAEDLGLKVDPRSGVEVDETLQAAPGVYAVGDIAAHLHPVYGRHMRVEHWQVAQRQGTAVAASIAGEPTPYTELPWFWSDQYGVNLQYVGNAASFDDSIVRGDINGESFSVFYLNGGVLDATLSVNDGKSGRFSRDLISGRIELTADARAMLADPGSDLRSGVRELTA